MNSALIGNVRAHWKTIWYWLRFLIGFILIAWIVVAVDWDTLKTAWLNINWWYVGLAYLMVSGVLFVSVIRWRVLLVSQNLFISLGSLLRYYLHGQFFLMVVPSFLGADGVRAWKIRQETQKTAGSVASVILERIMGLHAVATLGVFGAWLTPAMDDYQGVRWLVTGIFVTVSLVWFMILQPALFDFFIKYIPIKRAQSFLTDFREVNFAYRSQRKVLLKSWLLSVAIQLGSTFSIYFQILALGYRSISFLEVAAITNLIVIVSVLPISPGGLGLQEGSFVIFMGILGVDKTDAVVASLIARICNLTLALIGGIDYFLIDN